jgi:seryl-tRNA synthetase
MALGDLWVALISGGFSLVAVLVSSSGSRRLMAAEIETMKKTIEKVEATIAGQLGEITRRFYEIDRLKSDFDKMEQNLTNQFKEFRIQFNEVYKDFVPYDRIEADIRRVEASASEDREQLRDELRRELAHMVARLDALDKKDRQQK